MEKRKISVWTALIILAVSACSTVIDCEMRDGERYCTFHIESEVKK